MEQFRRIFNHSDTVSKECKSFVKTHERSMDEIEGVLGYMSEGISSMKEKFQNASSSLAISSQALAKLPVCNKLCEKILVAETGISVQQPDKFENPDHSYYREAIRFQVEEVNAEFESESQRLRDVYTEMREKLSLHDIE